MDLRHRTNHKKPHLCSCHFESPCFDFSHDLQLQLTGGSRTETLDVYFEKTIHSAKF